VTASEYDDLCNPDVENVIAQVALPRDLVARFDLRARVVLICAQHETDRFCHDFLGTEHILLGILKLGDTRAAKSLFELGLSLREARMAVEALRFGERSYELQLQFGLCPFTPMARKAVDLASTAAVTREATAEDLFDAVLCQPRCAARAVLEYCCMLDEMAQGRGTPPPGL
jgi:ATP-dependent Clp protease ATP-binding subunit ClpA